MKVSVVIPVYNEADRLDACLSAVARQTVKPLEVIVVDNNSTDDSATIARSYDFVTVLHEARQGVVYARRRGFDAARGDVIARIDADTILPTDWIRQILDTFRDNNIAAVSGVPHYYDFPFPWLGNLIDLSVRTYLARTLSHTILWGANMAVTRQAWHDVRSSLCLNQHLHEDFDLGIHLQQQGLKVTYDRKLSASVSSRRIGTAPLDYARYTLVSLMTYKKHRLPHRPFYLMLLVCWLCYIPGCVLYRGYNPKTRSFSFGKLLGFSASRVDPSANVA